MSKGGRRNGAGRPKGALSRRTQQFRLDVESSGLKPLEYLLKVMRDPGEEDRRRDWAAQAAAPYIHPRPQAVAAEKPPVVTREEGDAQLDMLAFARQVALVLYLGEKELEEREQKLIEQKPGAKHFPSPGGIDTLPYR